MNYILRATTKHGAGLTIKRFTATTDEQAIAKAKKAIEANHACENAIGIMLVNRNTMSLVKAW